jgi:hypothetical protein
MGKIIFTIAIFFALFFSVLSISARSADMNYFSKHIISSETDPTESWREYVLNGDQWYLIIHYDDGTIGVWPVAKPPND